MRNELPTAIRITKEAKNTAIENCEFRNCGIEDSGDETKLNRNKFLVTKDLFMKQPTWLKALLFLIGAITTAVIGIGIEKLLV